VAVDVSGNVYVADGANHRIQKFTNSGVYVAQWGLSGTSNGQFNSPRGVAVDGIGNVYVADSGNNRIQVFTSDGIFVTTWGTNGTENGQFSNPSGLAVAGGGNVYVADTYNNNRIQVFGSLTSGTSTSLTSAPNPSVTGQPITLTATVTPDTATGTVTFYDGAISLGTATLTNGTLASK
jgi:sugar lactone lactonase YvrE